MDPPPAVRSLAVRVPAILALVAVLVALCIAYGAVGTQPDQGDYPSSDDIAADYDAYVGQRVTVEGTVVSTDPLVIDTYRPEDSDHRLRVTDTAVAPERGATLKVHGVLEEDRTVRAVRAYAVPRGGYVYMYGVSALAGLWVLVRTVRDWRVDRRTVALAPRDRLPGAGQESGGDRTSAGPAPDGGDDGRA